jgi:CheY-like chemotaxis protein
VPEYQQDFREGAAACVVLYIEDDDAAAYMFQKALEHTGTNLRLFRIDDGEKGLAFLFREGLFHDAPVPDLVVLDLNLPKKNGFEVLAIMRSTESLKDLPVVMFTSSVRPEDRERAVAMGVNEFFVKSGEWEVFLAASTSICSLVQPPKPEHRAADEAARHIDYCLRILGIRVWSSACQLIARIDNGWVPIGAPHNLPIDLPADMAAAGDDGFVLTVLQYEEAHPGTDIRQVLTRQKTFAGALAEHD